MTSYPSVPLAGVIGRPVAHSRSPALHGFWLRRYGIKGHYVPLQIEADHLPNALKTLPQLGFVGANVTIPYKEMMFDLAGQISDRARAIGAVNTLVFEKDGSVFADNTDGYGFMANLRQNAPNWQPDLGPAAIFGAGGAARAVIVSLLEAGVPEIHLTNRNIARAEGFVRDFGPKIRVFPWDHYEKMLPQAAVVINTTALGMQGQAEFDLSLAQMPEGCLATDLVYTPLETGFLRKARAQGAVAVDGLGMLLHQAVPGFERWFGRCPIVDEETRKMVLNA